MTDAVETLLPLLGDRSAILHGLRGEGVYGGGDVDCLVENLDPTWPLRLPAGWRVCQVMRYDSTGCSWVLDHEGRTVPVDTLDDPRGLGKYSFPTTQSFGAGARAAYLTSKRIRKGMRDASDWRAIGRLASSAPDEYREALTTVFGRRLAAALAEGALAGAPPDERTWRRARRRRRAVLLRRPDRLARLAMLHATRLSGRLRNPTGLHVLVVGPDGAGKSTLAACLPRVCEGLFRRSLHIHWRPGILPRPGSIARRAAGDTAVPHSRAPYGRAASTLLLAYYWIDFVLGSFMRIWPSRFRSGLVIVERGWWDIAVDPARYRLVPMPRLVSALSRLLPRPDLVLLLDGDPEELHRRKPELPPEEIAAQLERWRTVLPPRVNRAVLNAADGDSLADHARRAIVDQLERRALVRLGAGWLGVPRSDARWLVPRARRQARGGLLVYNPVTVRARVGWELARTAASMGAMRLSPRATNVPVAVLASIADLIPRGGGFAVSASPSYAGRCVALVVDAAGRPAALAKIALDPEASRALAREREAIERYASVVSAPLRVPELLEVRPNALIFEAVRWRPVARPWRLDTGVAEALGRFYASTGAMHGDCTPWNLLRLDDGWALVDWEEAGDAPEPFADVFHYLVRSTTRLGRPRPAVLRAGAEGRGWAADAIRAYAEGAGLTAAEGFLRFSAHLASAGLGPCEVADAPSSNAVRA